MILASVNPKGGSGKSALAINLAGALAERGPVAVVDLDSDNRSTLDYASSGRLLLTVTDPTRGPAASTGSRGRTRSPTRTLDP